MKMLALYDGRWVRVNGGCAEPIGKQGRSRRRSYWAPARPTTLNVLTDIRRLLNSDLVQHSPSGARPMTDEISKPTAVYRDELLSDLTSIRARLIEALQLISCEVFPSPQVCWDAFIALREVPDDLRELMPRLARLGPPLDDGVF